MQSDAHAGEAPGLIDAEVGDDVRNPEAEDRRRVRAQLVVEPVVGGDPTLGEEVGRGHVERAELASGGIFHRQRAGEAVAELGGIGPEVLARRTGVTRDAHVVVAVRAAVGDEVEERLRPAHREAGELDERAVPERVEGRAAAGVCRRGVLRTEADVGPQRAVLGLLADVPRDRTADAVVDVVGVVAGEPARRGLAAGAVADRHAAAAAVVLGLDAQIAAHLDAGVGVGNVEEAVTVQAADLHVLNRRSLHRHIRRLRPGNRHQTRCGPEEKAFHHLHLNLHMLSWEGSISSGAAHPGRPLSPHHPACSRCPHCPLGSGSRPN
jgi:hypothetical protein